MKSFITLMAILLSGAVTTQAQVLPLPQTSGGMALMQAMQERKSSRDMDPNSKITNQEISNLLWAAWGITHDDKHTIGTAMNRQELSVYIITAQAISRYNPKANTLTRIAEGDFRNLVGMQDFAQTAPLNIALVVDTEKQNKVEFQAYSAAAASQNIYLYCASAGLKTVVRAAFAQEPLAKAMKLGENEKIMFVQTVGR